MIKNEVNIRVIINEPLAGVMTRVQRGRDEFLDPLAATPRSITFEFRILVDASGLTPNFLGPHAQGPKDARFSYVNFGRQAREIHSVWDRRAKLSLMSVTTGQVRQLVSDENAVLETSFPGTGRDGGPTCASVKGLEWNVVKR